MNQTEELRRLARAVHRLETLELREACEKSLLEFVRQHWHVIEPATVFVEGWAIEAICEHLEAVTAGKITRLLINVPPGSMKSLLVNVFWPAWEWATGKAHLRYVTFSYAAHLTERDNRRFRDVIQSAHFQRLFGGRFLLKKAGEELVNNDKTGFKLASSIGGVGTGERGDRVLLDDPHNVADGESEKIRESTVEWFSSAMSNRLNDMSKSAIVVVMQRVHQADVSGFILSKDLGYEHLCIPAEFVGTRASKTSIGWRDPRTKDGELFWPERFPPDVLATMRKLGDWFYSSQYQQDPVPAGGGIIKAADWKRFGEKIYPSFDYVVGSVDTAYTEKQENDPSAMTVWGVYEDHGVKRAMLIYAWEKRLELHGRPVKTVPGESKKDYRERAMPSWGLVEHIADTCQRFGVDTLLVESKASGHSVAQEMRRLYSHEPWGVRLVDPKSQDKVARLWSVQHLFADGLVSAPHTTWAQMVINQVAAFPKAEHDDLTDTTSMALRFIRDGGLLQLGAERAAELEDMMTYRKPVSQAPLYQV